MTGFETIAYKVAAGVLNSVATTLLRSALSPRTGALIVSAGSTGRLKNKLIPTVTITDKDIKAFSRHVVKIMTPLIEAEYSSLDENEVQAALQAVQRSFSAATVDIFEHDLNAQLYAASVITQSSATVNKVALSEAGRQFYQQMVTEVSAQMLNFVTTWPSFLARADVEQLKRLTKLAKDLDFIRQAVIDSATMEEARFEEKYSEVVITKLDQLELFGVTVSEPGRRSYPLSTAYISLSVAESGTATSINGELDAELADIQSREAWRSEKGAIVTEASGGLRAETAVSEYPRILLRGDAGSGKTTLLQWISVNAARRSLDGELKRFNGFVPFIVPLRRYADRQLPSAHEFLNEIGKHLAGEMPDRWVNRVLRSGSAFVLIDGVDELPESRREEAREWLSDLLSAYPRVRYIVTSRPAAAEEEWLRREEFASIDMLPMSPLDIDSFVHHWHDAARLCISGDSEDEYEELLAYESELIKAVRSQRQLRKLASNPLLCALLCTLSRDRRMQLPEGRMELYAAALEMLLVRRDVERRIKHQEGPSLTLNQKQRILGHFAYWLLRNQLTDSTEEQAIGQVDISLESMPKVGAKGADVYKYLMVRSGVLRRPVEGRVDFIHRTFQEYLAAANIVALNDVGSLVQNAHLDQWHEVVAMAVGHARKEECGEILKGLIERGNREAENKKKLHLLAAACLENADEFDRETYDLVRKCAARLIPPSKVSEAKELAAVGESVLPLLPRSGRQLLALQAASTVRTASLIGGETALDILSGFGADSRKSVYTELARAWMQFDVEEFARRVMVKSPFARRQLVIDHPELLPTLQYFSELEFLKIGFPLSDFDWVQWCPQLKWLSVRIENAHAVEKISTLSKLSYLHLTGVEEDAKWLQGLSSLQEIQTLSLRFLRNASLDAASLPTLTMLRLLEVGGAIKISNFSSISRTMPALESVSILFVGRMDFSGLERLPKLRSVRVWRADSFQNAASLSGMENVSVRIMSCDEEHFPELAKIERVKALRIDISDSLEERVVDLSPFRGKQNVIIRMNDSRFSPSVKELGEGVKITQPRKAQ